MADNAEPLNLSSFMGAAEAVSVERLTLYIPTKDRVGKEVANSVMWVERALKLLAKMGGGATRLPPVQGIWHDTENDVLITEDIILVYSFIDPEKFEKNIHELRSFLHSLGKETNQGEVVFELSEQLYKIRSYPHA